MFERDEQIYRDRDALRESYQPGDVVGRRSQLKMYQAALQPIINGEEPNNIFLSGKAGVGKTAVTRFLLENLRMDSSQYEEIDLTAELVNCDGVPTSYQLATRLINQLRTESAQISTTGYSEPEIYQKLRRELECVGGTVLFVLDEIDHLENNTILSQLTRVQAEGILSKTKLGIISITNDFSFRASLSPRTETWLCEEEIHFPAYRASELSEILAHRSDIAFYDDVVDAGAIERCAALGARGAGDARQALDLMMKAGDIARENGDQNVTSDHVINAQETLKRGRVVEGISGLTKHGKVVLYALLTRDLEDSGPSSCGRLFPRYQEFANQAGIKPLTPQGVNEHLDELSMLGLISTTERAKNNRSGATQVYQTDISQKVALTALEKVIKEIGLHQALESISDEPAFLFTPS